MNFSELLARLPHRIVTGDAETAVTELVYDSRKAGPGSAFVCVCGMAVDGHKFFDDVIEKGASAVLIQEDHADTVDLGRAEENGVCIAAVPDTRYGLAMASAAYFKYPAETLPVVGVTGTKGKTTTTYMVKSILEHTGKKAGLIGTIEIDTGAERIHADNTTPESYLVQKYLRDMIDNGCDLAVMEVSSQALMLDRTAGILFEIGVFTNLEPDHIGPNEHKDFEEYLQMKSRLFKQCRTGIFNIDDEHCEAVMEGHTCAVETISAKRSADFYAENIEQVYRPGYLGVQYDLKGRIEMPVELDIPGLFTVYNSLTSVAVAAHFSATKEAIADALKAARVRGRVEIVDIPGDFTLMIDYAHNAMALKSLLTTLKAVEPARLVCLFGCGGNRARSRRFEMGEVSGTYADLTIVTSDNPRFEEPDDIIADILTGVKKTEGKYITIADRKEAIRHAITKAEPGDVIVLAGKGHEDYQEIRGVKYPMDERDLIADILKEEGIA